jgi:mannose-6-phosphate isomerase-like protein (cupin superfamily)
MKSAVFCVTSSLLLALSLNSKAEAHGMEVFTGIDWASFIEMTGIDDFVAPTPETLSNYESVWVVGVDRATFIATGEDTEGRYTLAEFYVPPQAGAPPHIHRRENEWFYITDGELSFKMDNQIINATPGTLIYGPKDHAHTFMNEGTDPAKMLNVWLPSGIEEFFREIGDPVTLTDPFTPPLPPDIPRLIAAAPKYGLEFLPPEDNNPTPVPEPSASLGMLAFAALVAISIRKRQHKPLSNTVIVNTTYLNKTAEVAVMAQV